MWNFPLFMIKYFFGWLMKIIFFETESTGIWIIHIMTSIVSLGVVSGDEFLVTQSIDVQIVRSITLHVSMFIVPGDESFSTQNTLI